MFESNAGHTKKSAAIFISYAHQDRPKASALAAVLEARGWPVWWDHKIPLGRSFDEVIERELESARCVVVLWTTNSLASRWVKAEAQVGLDRGALLPVLLDHSRPPLAFRDLETAQLLNWSGESNHPELEKLVQHIAQLVEPAASAEAGREAERADSAPVERTESSSATATPPAREDERSRPAIEPQSEKPQAPADGTALPPGAGLSRKRVIAAVMTSIVLGVALYAISVGSRRQVTIPPAPSVAAEPPAAAPAANAEFAKGPPTSALPQGVLGLILGGSLDSRSASLDKELQREAEGGSVEAQFLLGVDLEETDPNEALKWYRKAAARGHALARTGVQDLGVKPGKLTAKEEMALLSRKQDRMTAALNALNERAQAAIRNIKGG